MGIERVFLGWEEPALVAAAHYLARRFGSAGQLDLGRVIVGVPGSRAGRRLLEILVGQAQERRWALVPPAITTLGHIPELLYEPGRPTADPLTQSLAWGDALRRGDPACWKPLFPALPAEDDFMPWLALGDMLGGLHQELAGEGLDGAAVVAAGGRMLGPGESARWQTIAALEREYLAVLDELELADLQTARQLAVKHGQVRTEARIVLVGAADMNRLLRQMLDQVAERTTALIFAPETLADRFDPYGCVRPEAWQDAPVDLSSDQIEVVGNASDQAAATVRTIALLGGRYRAEDITVGVPDERVIPYLQQHFEQCGLAGRYGVGVPARQTAPCRLLRAAAEYLRDRRFAALAALVRHPAVQGWLEERMGGVDWLTEMDEYHAEHLPHRVPQRWSPPRGYPALRRVYGAVEGLLGGLSGGARPLDQWNEPIARVLVDILGCRGLDAGVEPDRTVLEVCERMRQVLRQHSAVRPPLMPAVDAVKALELLLRQVEDESIPPLAQPEAIELLGWLELPLDDAPVLIVTGFNEGIVPGSLGADLFLPNQLRHRLGIEDNDRRYARDAYALSALAASRQRLKIIAGRRTAEGDPLAPSRILLACDDRLCARRVLEFFAEEKAPPSPLVGWGLRPGKGRFDPQPPRPRPLAQPVASMRVTEFRDYLACPYRYYLRHRLGLASPSDAATELDGAAFGSLAHAVLGEFGRDPISRSTDPAVIEAWLNEALDRLVAECYGKSCLPAVHVQIEQLRARLGAFARWQADWVKDGWQIEHAEASPADETAAITVDGQAMALRGRIDRIDVHRSGQRAVFDYKTADQVKTPEQTHRQAGEWIDLQLPLYHHLLGGMGIEGDIVLGYIVLPKDIERTGACIAEWGQDELRQADQRACEVVRKVRAEEFWPPTTPPPAGFEEFAAICRDDQFAPVQGAEEGEDGP